MFIWEVQICFILSSSLCLQVQENQTWEKNVPMFNFFLINSSSDLCVMHDLWLIFSIYHLITYMACSGLLLVKYVDFMCRLQCVNYFLCSLQNILLLNTFSKFHENMKACCFKRHYCLLYNLRVFALWNFSFT
jgi:hypothetical protein